MKPAPKLHYVILSMLLGGILLISGCQKEPLQKPNILFAIADDWSWPHAGVYGDPVVQTPAFDRLAKEGILFNHAYISSPSCTPSRNAILTGQYHWRLGPGANLWSTLDPATPVYPLLLEDAGYMIGYYRKSWGPGDISNWERHPAGANYTEGGFAKFMADRESGQPFCFWLGSWDPHRPYDRGTGAASGMDLDKIRLFECFPDHDIVRSDVADYYYEVQRFDTLVASAIAILEKYGELENTIIVMTGDHGMPFPRCKANNYDSGARIPLAVRWGSGIKKQGRVLDDFISTTDLAPTFLELAGVDVPEVMTGKSMLNILQSTQEGFVDTRKPKLTCCMGRNAMYPRRKVIWADIPAGPSATMTSFTSAISNPSDGPTEHPTTWRQPSPIAGWGIVTTAPPKPTWWRTKRRMKLHRKLWELSFGMRPSEELYDCKNDPEQLVNLAADPDYTDVKEMLSAQLMEQLERTGDPRTELVEDFDFDAVPYLGSGPRHPSYQPE